MANAPEPVLPGRPAALVGVWSVREAACLLPGESERAVSVGVLIVSSDGYDGDGVSCRLAGVPLLPSADGDASRILSFACAGAAGLRSEAWHHEVRPIRIAGWDVRQPEPMRDGRRYRKCALEATAAK